VAVEDNELIVTCLVEGLPLNMSMKSHGAVYKTLTGSEECGIHPSSVLFGGNCQAQRILFSEIVKTSKLYMRCVTDASSVQF
jgi:hypothetical protein